MGCDNRELKCWLSIQPGKAREDSTTLGISIFILLFEAIAPDLPSRLVVTPVGISAVQMAKSGAVSIIVIVCEECSSLARMVAVLVHPSQKSAPSLDGFIVLKWLS